MTKTARLAERDLRQFTGSENWYQHSLKWNVTYTDGAKCIADEGAAYWLLDTIAFCQGYEIECRCRGVPGLDAPTTVLTCGDGNDNILYTHLMEFTDFPIDEITLWFANGVIYLPSEH